MNTEIKKIYRSRDERVIFGVCGGLGKYFGIDPLLFRILFISFLLINGSGIIIYLILFLVLPLEIAGEKNEIKKYPANQRLDALGWILLVVGVLYLMIKFFGSDHNFGSLFAILLIFSGVGLLLHSAN